MPQGLLGRSFALDEVFVPRGLPTVTLVDRSGHPKYGELMREIMQGGFINLHGDSRSGKTVNCVHITSSALAATQRTVLINRRSFDTEAGFWEITLPQNGGLCIIRQCPKSNVRIGSSSTI
jgi:hypothetical protein